MIGASLSAKVEHLNGIVFNGFRSSVFEVNYFV